jgi:hypothetical protein
MAGAARALEFEQAAALRDRIHTLTNRELLLRDPSSKTAGPSPRGAASTAGSALGAPGRSGRRGSQRRQGGPRGAQRRG